MTDYENRKSGAYWYAVGRYDVEGPGPDLSWAFACFAADQAAAYYVGETSHLACIPDQWREFLGLLDQLKES